MGKPHTLEETVSILSPVASALDYAHARGVLHRDVKPSNIMLTGDATPILGDFGLAKMMGGTDAHLTMSGMIVGTPEYMAPEQCAGQDIDATADVYSLAAVIFEAVTGRRPFSSKSWIETLSRRLYEPPPTVHDVVPELPAPFAAVLQQAMDRDPNRRPATAGELLDRLDAALNSPGPGADLVHWLQPVMHRGSIGLSAVLVLVVGVAEVAWLLEGSGLTLVMHFAQRLFGVH
jgi:serine/threonine protein kinase